MTSKPFWLAALLASAVPIAAQAQSAGYYLGAGAGLNFADDSSISGTGINLDSDYDTGWVGAIALGRRYDSGFRGELELNIRSNGVDSIGGAAASGDLDSWAVMANVLYEFTVDAPVTPYVGGGVGIAVVDLDNASPVGTSVISDSDTVFAYQGIAGASYGVRPDLEVFGDYRFFGTADPELTTAAGTSVESEYQNHSLLVGVRWSFDAPWEKDEMAAAEPAPEPTLVEPAAVEAPKTPAEPVVVAKKEDPKETVPRLYMIFFEFDREKLTPEAQRIVETAANNTRKTDFTRIVVTGHADRSGTDAYNLGLSLRRAKMVRAELLSFGIAEDNIEIVAKGERQPMVSTADGAQEPRNRRVEIVY